MTMKLDRYGLDWLCHHTCQSNVRAGIAGTVALVGGRPAPLVRPMCVCGGGGGMLGNLNVYSLPSAVRAGSLHLWLGQWKTGRAPTSSST